MKKVLFVLTFVFLFVAFASQANAQAPEVYALGALGQSDDATLMYNYNAIESNQPVYQVYDVDLIVDYYENGNYLGGYEKVGINFAEIPIGIPAVPYNIYDQFSYYSLKPVDICGGFIDYFGFSICYGGNYLFPYTFEGGCAPVCIPAALILLGAFILEAPVLPTITLNSVTANPNSIRASDTSFISISPNISSSTGVPANTKLTLRASPINASVNLSMVTDPEDISKKTDTIISAQQSRSFPFGARFTDFPMGTTFPQTVKVKVSIDDIPGLLIINPMPGMTDTTPTITIN